MLKDKDIYQQLVATSLHKLGTGADTKTSPIHRWFSYMPSFSPQLITDPLGLSQALGKSCNIFDPFIGCGTTAVAGTLLGHHVIGHEANEFMLRISKGKLSYSNSPETWKAIASNALDTARHDWRKTDISNEHQLIKDCFSKTKLQQLVSLRKLYNTQQIPEEFKALYFLAISSLIPKCTSVSIHPYVSWNHPKKAQPVFPSYQAVVDLIYKDMLSISISSPQLGKARLFLHDSRKPNNRIKDNSIDFILTSPPYLNNYDYGESTKIFGYFWRLTNNWAEVTKKVRKQMITSATTHYTPSDFRDLQTGQILGQDFKDLCPKTYCQIVKYADQVKSQIETRGKAKTFDILVPLYFKDMFHVLAEMIRVIKSDHPMLIVVGDSAPYGVHIPTDALLLGIAKELGVRNQTMYELRVRGKKWMNLSFRHQLQLRESLLVITK